MDKVLLKKGLQEFNNSVSNEGICCINTEAENIELSVGVSAKSNKHLNLILEKEGFKSLNSQFNSLFYERGFPDLVSFQCEDETRFVKFLDSDHIIYTIIDLDKINYTKVKSHLDMILAV